MGQPFAEAGPTCLPKFQRREARFGATDDKHAAMESGRIRWGVQVRQVELTFRRGVRALIWRWYCLISRYQQFSFETNALQVGDE